MGVLILELKGIENLDFCYVKHVVQDPQLKEIMLKNNLFQIKIIITSMILRMPHFTHYNIVLLLS